MTYKILVIDDEPTIVELVKNRLEAHHYCVVTACNGLEGIAKLEEERPDLVLLDVLMPLVNGLTFVKIIKRYEAFASIPIIIFTVSKVMEGLFFKEGVNGYLLKPFQTPELLDKVSALLKGQPAAQ